MTSQFRLDAIWRETDPKNGSMILTLTNLSDQPISGFRLAYTSLLRVSKEHVAHNATFIRRFANFHEFDPLDGLVLGSGESWTFELEKLTHIPKHRNDGPKSAYLTLKDGTHVKVDTGDMALEGRVSKTGGVLVPEGKLDLPIALSPWPNQISVSQFSDAPVAFSLASATREEKAAAARVNGLSDRLFTDLPNPFSLIEVPGGLTLSLSHDGNLAEEGYSVSFAAAGVSLAYGAAKGLINGLISLAQIINGPKSDPTKFQFPAVGTINDAPRFGWRGSHLDVSRQFYPFEDVKRFVDILAWNKMNILHWHLSDDEGWRVEIKAYPELTNAGAKRGANEAMPAQLGSGFETYGGFYTQEQIKELIAHGEAINVEIVPELDIPGHCTAVLAAYPDLRDPDEPEESYRSIQGYPNNALNPGLPATYKFIETVVEEIADLFPSKFIHVGGDEVDENSWMESPAVEKLMNEERLNGTMQVQAHFLGKVQKMIKKKGKIVGGWDEVSHGGGIEKEGGTLLFAWQKAEVGITLAEEGYDVVMTPGQAYYLDMAQSEEWQEPGASWAGTASPQTTYEFEAAGDFSDELKPRIKGVQACIWSEHLISRELFNHMVFPRLSAIAEAAWTEPENKNWLRFAAQSHHLPRL
ncbi:beta-N-acetylhexosaminidase [Maritalea porphyrae]|uniref:beta-N-acetylhexosaminidase n=1 Tax=Maritalea porphyrae TaxID=880732 RepID=A0ABQ5USW3_9HYPH|nr:family 20 glycosylhydrolase [Maritalea porphyrae]GLQ17648.1 beta-N-acetylhexosaminidase [Maritalea porphyrae]